MSRQLAVSPRGKCIGRFLGDGLVGLLRLIAGAGEREPWEESYSPTAPSRVTHVAQCVVFGAVMADAAMLDSVLEMDVWESERGADGRPRHDG